MGTDLAQRPVGAGLAAILLTNAMWTSPRPPAVALDFLTGVYAAIAD